MVKKKQQRHSHLTNETSKQPSEFALSENIVTILPALDRKFVTEKMT